MMNPKWYILAVARDELSPPTFKEFKNKEEMNTWLRKTGETWGYMKIISGYTIEERGELNERESERIH